MCGPSEIFTQLLEEMDRRNLPITNDMLMTLEIEKASPSLILKCFLAFIETPTLEIAYRLFQAFERLPPLHLVCVNESLKRFGQSARRGLEQIGRAIMTFLENPIIGLEYFYHPVIKYFVREVELARGNPKECRENEVVELIEDIEKADLYFLLPLLIELPDWFEYVAGLENLPSEPWKVFTVIEMIASL
jgi:hypothetical protein